MPNVDCVYRKNGGYVETWSLDAAGDGHTDTAVWGIASVPDTNMGAGKVYDAGSIRDATSQELTDYPTKVAEDNEVEDKARAKTDSDNRKELKALTLVVLDEINILRNQHSLAERTQAQIKAAIENKIDTL